MSTKHDTHFQNAAKRLFYEMDIRGFISFDLLDNEPCLELLARYAYDVAFHTLSDMSESDVFLFNRGERKVEEIVPDLDEWPHIPEYDW